MRILKPILIVCCLIIAFMTHPVRAVDDTVSDCTNFTGTDSISDAVANANSGGGTITFLCSGTIVFDNALIITADVVINANGNTVIFDESGDNNNFFAVNAGASLTLNGFTLQNGNGVFGGAIYNLGTLTINNSTLSNNSAGFGGAISSAGTLTINNSTLSNNSAQFGGAIYNLGTLTINNSTLSNNSASDDGGAIYSAGTLNITTSTLSNNSASDEGGAIINFDTLNISTSTLSGNSAPFGGAISNAGTVVDITNSTLSGNSAQFGGVISNSGTVVDITNSTLSNNSSTNNGGAIFNYHLSAMAIVIITNSTLSNNSATNNGGAILNIFGTVDSQDTHYAGTPTNNTCDGDPVNDLGGNTKVHSTGCPGDPPIDLSVSPLTCSGDNLVFEILTGDADFSITGTGPGLPISPAAPGLYGLIGPSTWTGIVVTELRGDRQSLPLGGIICPDAVVIPPPTPSAPSTTVLGCALDATDGIELANVPDNTYCRELMKNGVALGFSGAVPQNLIDLGVIYAVDVYRLEGGRSITEFPTYVRVCLAGQGRLFYLDARTSPRAQVELTTEREGNFTCGWIPAVGTLVLTR